jgi:hypothetical protein
MGNKGAIFYCIAATALLAPNTYASPAALPSKSDAGIATVTEQASVPGNQLRFPVAHLHIGTWCMGYFYVTEEGIRYEVVGPEKYKGHSFQLQRSEMKAVQPWNLMGQLQNIAEIKAARANYHFYLLQSEADLDPARRWSPASAAPATTLLTAIANPSGAVPGTSRASSDLASPGNSPAPPSDSAVTPAPSSQPPLADSQPSVLTQPAAAQPSSPSPLPSGALEGIYVALSLRVGRVQVRYLLFTRDGWVFRDFPEDGMEGFDATAFRNDPNRNKSWTGRYRLDGNQIHILWQDWADDREILERNENAAAAGINVFVPICRCTSKMFSGAYLWGLPNSGQYLQFFPDGTFLDRGTTDQMFVPSPFYEHPRVLRGTYSIQNQTLTLDFSDGRRAKRTFLAPKAQEHQQLFDWIGLGLHRLYEQHYQPAP